MPAGVNRKRPRHASRALSVIDPSGLAVARAKPTSTNPRAPPMRESMRKSEPSHSGFRLSGLTVIDALFLPDIMPTSGFPDCGLSNRGKRLRPTHRA